MPSEPRINAREKLLGAAVAVIRRQGFSATSVEDLCREAGVTKGAFFHHFASKDELGVAAARHWSETTGALFENAEYHKHADPLDRVLAYVDFREALVEGELPEFTCLVGTMVQETYDASPAIRQACRDSIFGHAETLEADFARAITAAGLGREVNARSLAVYTQAVIQGGFIVAKASGNPDYARDSIRHLRRYLELLFRGGKRQ